MNVVNATGRSSGLVLLLEPSHPPKAESGIWTASGASDVNAYCIIDVILATKPYSYGDSAGFTPASLLMTLASTKFTANVEQ